MTADSKNKFKTISTATIATILYRKGLRNQCIQEVRPLSTMKVNMIGEAFTLRYIPAREDLNQIEVFRDPKHPQRVAVETCPIGGILVIDSRKDARAASAGSILVSRLQKRGVVGIVTDGGFRDSEEISKMEIAAYHKRPAAPTNLTHHQALDINVPIACGDVAVFPGDLLVGDQDGVMVVPKHLIDEVAEEGENMELYEEFVMEIVATGRSIIGLYPPTDQDIVVLFEGWKTRKQDSSNT